MTHYKSHDQYCFGEEWVTNFEIGFPEVIAGLSLKVMFISLSIILWLCLSAF